MVKTAQAIAHAATSESAAPATSVSAGASRNRSTKGRESPNATPRTRRRQTSVSAIMGWGASKGTPRGAQIGNNLLAAHLRAGRILSGPRWRLRASPREPRTERALARGPVGRGPRGSPWRRSPRYRGTLAGPLIYDDHLWITWNPSIRHLWPLGGALFAPATPVVHGRPVLSLSLALNYAVSGNDAWSYHVANLAIHVLVGARALRGRQRGPWHSARPVPAERDCPAPARVRVALLWAVHPLQTEAVTYVIQRAESLMGLFYLLTLYCFIRGVRGAPGRALAPAVGRPRAFSAWRPRR